MKRRIISVIAVLLALLTALMTCSAFAGGDSRFEPLTEEDALKTSGTHLVNKKGEQVFLRGINLGGWLIQEDWFCPADNGKRGDHYTLETFVRRFGTEKAYELYNIYQDAWIKESDFMNIADMGFNCVRIPFWYRNFQSDDNGTWITDRYGEPDFSRLEWAVEMCRKYGLYAILDLHGAPGCQGMQDHCGQKNNYHFFDRNKQGENYRRRAVELWELIAEKFKGDPAIAMFDLLNEPMCDVPIITRIHAYINDFYDDAYKAIRKVDPDRVITMIGTWDIGKLPSPAKMGWTNVVYQYHQYGRTKRDYEQPLANTLKLSKSYNVPVFAGEFHPVTDKDNQNKVELREVIDIYDNNNIMWALWTYKGYNSWAAWADWFAYGSVKDELIVRPETDSFDEIARKWGAMSTNSGNFYKGHLFDVAYEFLPNAVSPSTPFNKIEETEPSSFHPTVAPTPQKPTESPDFPTVPNPSDNTTAQPADAPEFSEDGWIAENGFITVPDDKITPKQFRDCCYEEVKLSSLSANGKYVTTGTLAETVSGSYIVIIKMDCNRDGIVNSSDARVTLRCAAKIITLSGAEATAADVDKNGRINSSDARIILRRCAKLI